MHSASHANLKMIRIMWRSQLQSLTKTYLGVRKPWVWILITLLLWGLLLGLLAPWIIKNQLIKMAQQRLELTLQIEKLRINPYLFTLTIENLQTTQASGEPLVGFSLLHINVETFSLFRWAWSLKQAHLLGVYAHITRHDDGTSNVSQILERWQATQPVTDEEQPIEDETTTQGITRFFIEDIQLHIERVSLIDKVPQTHYDTDLGPITLNVAELSTLPDRIGQQSVLLQTENGAQITWSGSVTLTPLSSNGKVDISGELLTTATDYLTDQLNFYIPSGHVSAGFNYAFVQQPERPHLQLTNIHTALTDLKLIEKQTEQPIFRLQQLATTNGELQWPEKTVTLGTIAFDQGEVFVRKNTEGSINLANLIIDNRTDKTPETDAIAADDTSDPWRVHNNTFTLNDWSIHLQDNSLPTPSKISTTHLQLQVNNLSNQANTPIQMTFATQVAQGDIQANGELTPIPLSNINTQVSVNKLQLPILQPYIEPVAKVLLNKGLFNANIHLTSNTDNALSVQSDMAISDFELLTSQDKQKILAWNTLSINDIHVTVNEQKTQISKIELNQPYVDFAIDKDGINTLQKVLIERSSAPVAQPPHVSNNDKEQASPAKFSIASIIIKDASGKFSDLSLPLPFKTAFSELNGNIATIDNASREASDVKLQGRIDQYGLIKVAGALTPFNPEHRTAIDVAFKNVDIPSFSPYSIKFAGRTIEKGRMNLDLGYAVKNSKLVGRNSVELQKLTLGKRVEQPGAMDLPLDLAIALLKDGDGNIQVDLPIDGDINDPNFNYGKVVGQALTRMITSIVSSPFRLLGKLVGRSDENFDRIDFYPGSTEITPPEQEKLTLLAKALEQRPSLMLIIKGAYNPQLDILALQTQQFEQLEETNFGTEKLASLSRSASEYIKFAEQRYLAANSKESMQEIEQQHTHAETENSKPQRDKLAYASALRQALIRKQSLAPRALSDLADQRAQSIQHYLAHIGYNNSESIRIISNEKTTSAENGVIPLQLKLDVP